MTSRTEKCWEDSEVKEKGEARELKIEASFNAG